jgi:hypothetical protein
MIAQAAIAAVEGTVSEGLAYPAAEMAVPINVSDLSVSPVNY